MRKITPETDKFGELYRTVQKTSGYSVIPEANVKFPITNMSVKDGVREK